MAQDAQPLLVIGAGPKAAAIAAKSRILRDQGIPAPPVYVLENKQIAANWNGDWGFTSGSQRLGTPPEKDIGFPYEVDRQNPLVTKEMFSQYSWLYYMLSENGGYGEWIDRGRPHPTHREWANYIRWSIIKAADKICIGEVSLINQSGENWIVEFSENGRKNTYVGSGLVITSPGSRKIPNIAIPNHRNILYGDNFWKNLDRLNYIVSGVDAPPIVVVGGGETAGSIVSYLIDHFGGKSVPILVLTRSGTIFSRGEGYYENRMFTETGTWKNLPPAVRRDVIKRGDRGVFSVEVSKKLAYSHNIDHCFEEVKSINVSAFNGRLVINKHIDAQMIILALGFDSFFFTEMLTKDLEDIFSDPGEREFIEENINDDLSVSHPAISAKLFLPMISAFAQGPGFPNLSCLGRLSDRILGRDTG